jgi:hypothetical protein
MHSVLFVAIIPPQKQDWMTFVQEVGKKLQSAKGATRLAENVWLLDLHKNTAALGWLIACAEKLGISQGLLAFEHEPQWLPAGFDPKPIQDRSGD